MALGGISVGASLATFVLWAFAFLRLGTAGFTAQAYGAEDGDEIKATLNRGLALAWIFGFVLLLVMVPIAFVAMPLFGSTEAVADLAARYFHYRLFSAPFDLTNYVIFGWLVGLQRIGRALGLQFLLNGLNVALCWLLVYQLHLGVDGAAIATALAQVVTAVAGFIVARRLLRIVPLSDESGCAHRSGQALRAGFGQFRHLPAHPRHHVRDWSISSAWAPAWAMRSWPPIRSCSC